MYDRETTSYLTLFAHIGPQTVLPAISTATKENPVIESFAEVYVVVSTTRDSTAFGVVNKSLNFLWNLSALLRKMEKFLFYCGLSF